MVHAGGAADAAKHLLEIGPEHRGAAVIDQYDVVFLRPVQIAVPPRTGGEGGVNGKVLAGGGARQQPQQAGGVLQGRHHFFDAGQHDMDARQGLGQVAVALVGDDHRTAGFRDQEVGAGDPDIGGQELLPQLGARFGQDVAAFVEHAVDRQVGMGFAELVLPVLAVQVERRGDDVAGQLVAQLDDVFAEVGFHRRDAVALQMLVDADFLGDHALPLGHRAGPGLLADRQHRRTGIVGGGAPMQLPAGGGQPGLVSLQVEIQVGEGVVLDVAADIAQLLEFRQPGDRCGAPANERRTGIGQGFLQANIDQRVGGALLEGGTGDDMHSDVLLLPGNLADAAALGTPEVIARARVTPRFGRGGWEVFNSVS